ncbi:hypothetical protein HH308_29185 [Gordonia sp. TBRC 11910]|uniref:Pali-domain-containing protein n=1 Tax=Gordonia asplenii TaxID=2725283 RepID=A0A848L3J4_9ACTN|nr:hypothetical protein [Gordonia asplenii]NMO05299.1 hypothetical protein [Gordonia asplenii]
MTLQVLTILVGFGTWGTVDNSGVNVTNSGFGTLKLNGGTLSGVKVPGLDATWSPPSPAILTTILAVLIFIAAVFLVLDKFAMIAAAAAVALAAISFLQICYLWTDISSHVLGDSSASDDGSTVGAGWGLMVALFLVFLTLAAMALWWFARLVSGRRASAQPPTSQSAPPK